jgi:hypothetical protein
MPNSTTLVKWAKAPMPEEAAQIWRDEGIAVPQRYVVGPHHAPVLNALIAREEIADDDLRWHISVSRQDRLPDWGELVTAAHELRPGIVFVIGVPPKSWWINIHPFCLHLFETRDPHLIEQWRAEGRGDRHT